MGALTKRPRFDGRGRQLAELLRYGMAGGFTTILGFSVYAASVMLGLPYLGASALSWAVGVVVAFFLQARFVFRKASGRRQFVIFVMANLTALATNMGLLSLFVRGLGMHPIVAALIATPLTVLASFVGLKFVVFR